MVEAALVCCVWCLQFGLPCLCTFLVSAFQDRTLLFYHSPVFFSMDSVSWVLLFGESKDGNCWKLNRWSQCQPFAANEGRVGSITVLLNLHCEMSSPYINKIFKIKLSILCSYFVMQRLLCCLKSWLYGTTVTSFI